MDCRLIIDGPASGVWNMAADEALLEAAEAGVPTLRLYQWAPATLSLGYFQRLEERHAHAASQHCPVVRRASGGGAILHDRELTYSFAVPNSFAPRPAELYTHFHATLAETLSRPQLDVRRFGDVAERAAVLPGVPPGACGEQRPRVGEPFLCFARRTAEDLTAEDVKLAGSAQRRLRGALLQHGSILLAASTAAPELPGLAELGVRLTADELAEAWLPRLAARLALRWTPAKWTPELRRRAAAIAAAKFATAEWNAKR